MHLRCICCASFQKCETKPLNWDKAQTSTSLTQDINLRLLLYLENVHIYNTLTIKDKVVLKHFSKAHTTLHKGLLFPGISAVATVLQEILKANIMQVTLLALSLCRHSVRAGKPPLYRHRCTERKEQQMSLQHFTETCHPLNHGFQKLHLNITLI